MNRYREVLETHTQSPFGGRRRPAENPSSYQLETLGALSGTTHPGRGASHRASRRRSEPALGSRAFRRPLGNGDPRIPLARSARSGVVATVLLALLVLSSPLTASELASEPVQGLVLGAPAPPSVTPSVPSEGAAPEARSFDALVLPTQPIPITAPDGLPSHSPAIAVDPSGNYCVAWVDERDGNREIYFVRVAPSGAVLQGPLNLSQTSVASVSPDVAVDGLGTAHIAWQEGTANGEGSILLSRVNALGEESLNNLVVSGGFCAYPALTATALGETWLGFRRREAGLYPIYSAKVSAAGVKSCERRTADNSLVGIDNSLSIDWNTAGQVVATFHDIWNFQEFAGLQVWSGSCAGGCASGCGSRCQWFSSNELEHTSLTSPLPNLVYVVFENDPGIGRRIYSLTSCNGSVLLSDTPGPSVNPSLASPEGFDRPLVIWEDRSASITEIRVRDAKGVGPSQVISIGIGNSSLPDIAVKDTTHWAAVWQNDRAGALEIYLAGTEVPVTPAFEIVSATADSALYQNGADAAYVDVVVRSNWGASDQLDLSLELEHFSGDVPIGTENFALLPGGQHVSRYTWGVPNHSRFRAFDAHARLFDGGVLTLERVFLDVVQTAPLPDATLQDARDAIAECAPPGASCALAVAGIVPVAGTLGELSSMTLNACEVLSGAASGDFCRMAVGSLGLVLDAIGLVLELASPVSGFVLTTPEVLTSAISALIQCALEAYDPCGSPTAHLSIIPSSNEMRTLAEHIRASWDSLGLDYSNEILAYGAARISVLADGAATTPDSVGMDDCWLFELPSSGVRWAHAGSSPTRFGNPDPNAHASIVARFDVVADDTLDVLLLHRNAEGLASWLEYPPIPFVGAGVAWIELSDAVSIAGLQVDRDGDGTIDEVHMPNLDTAPGEELPVRFVMAPPRPNPGRSTFASTVVVPAPGGWLTARVMDVRGGDVARVAAAWFPPGEHALRWNGRDAHGRAVPSGTYWMVSSFQGEIRSTKLTVLR